MFTIKGKNYLLACKKNKFCLISKIEKLRIFKKFIEKF